MRAPWQVRVNLVTRVLLLSIAVGLAIGGAALLIIQIAIHAGLNAQASRQVSAYLHDVKDAKYSQAYDRLCAGVGPSREEFESSLTQANLHGHGVKSYSIYNTFTKETLTLSTAVGTVTFADGTTKSLSYDVLPLNQPGAPKCISGYDGELSD
jgi:hypothetical protein